MIRANGLTLSSRHPSVRGHQRQPTLERRDQLPARTISTPRLAKHTNIGHASTLALISNASTKVLHRLSSHFPRTLLKSWAGRGKDWRQCVWMSKRRSLLWAPATIRPCVGRDFCSVVLRPVRVPSDASAVGAAKATLIHHAWCSNAWCLRLALSARYSRASFVSRRRSLPFKMAFRTILHAARGRK